MGYLEEAMGIGDFGSLLGGGYLGSGFYSGPGSPYNALAAMQQQHRGISDPFEFQREQARMMQAMQPYPTPTPPHKKVESKVIETVKIRPEQQDVKLLRAGEAL